MNTSARKEGDDTPKCCNRHSNDSLGISQQEKRLNTELSPVLKEHWLNEDEFTKKYQLGKYAPDIKAQLRKEIEKAGYDIDYCLGSGYDEDEHYKVDKKGDRFIAACQKEMELKATLSGIEQGEKLERERIKGIIDKIRNNGLISHSEELTVLIAEIDTQETGE